MQIKREIVQAYIILIIACVFWGSMFVPQKIATQYTGAMNFTGMRLLLGGLVLLLVSVLLKRPFTVRTYKNGLILGVILGVSSCLQQFGMHFTTATNAGFITGLYLLFVPMQLTLWAGRNLNAYLWIGAILTFIGLGLLCLTEGFHINSGDFLIFVCAVTFTQHIILVDRYINKNDFLSLASVQFIVAGTLSLFAASFTGENLINGAALAWKEIIYGGLFSIGYGHTAQLYAQRVIPPTQSALLCSLEAIFAAITAWFILSERLNGVQFCGCLLMFTGIILACIKSNEKKQNAAAE